MRKYLIMTLFGTPTYYFHPEKIWFYSILNQTFKNLTKFIENNINIFFQELIYHSNILYGKFNDAYLL